MGRLEASQSQAQVARELDVTLSVISNLWSQFKTSGTVCKRPGRGRPKGTTTNEDLYLFLSVKRHRTATASQLSRDLAAATGTSVSTKSVSRRLYERGLYARKAVCLFASHSLPSLKERVQNGADNIRMGHNFNGLMFSSPMSLDSVYNLILDGY